MAPLPPTGFGWDEHAIMPALVLAARPLAQIVQITYVSLMDVLRQDYIRTAHAKGLRQRWVIVRHALRNVLVPVLTTLGASLRFSLASLPVVEVFFVWPGVGLALWRAIGEGNEPIVTDVMVLLGLFFLVVNGLLEAALPHLAPNHAGHRATARPRSPRPGPAFASGWRRSAISSRHGGRAPEGASPAGRRQARLPPPDPGGPGSGHAGRGAGCRGGRLPRPGPAVRLCAIRCSSSAASSSWAWSCWRSLASG